MTTVVLEQELCRLASFAARMVHAQSCFIFLPSDYISAQGNRGLVPSTTITPNSKGARFSASGMNLGPRKYDWLELKGHWSSIAEIQTDARVPADSGLIGWIVKQQRPLHISPFENDSGVLGAYVDNVTIRSFFGLPIFCSTSAHSTGIDGEGGESTSIGVLLCDHAREMAFTRAHGQVLQEIVHQVSLLLNLNAPQASQGIDLSWASFVKKGVQLCEALGFDSLAVIRFASTSFSEVERELGTVRALELDDQIYRLVTQALPPHFPVARLPNGDIIVLVDLMMASFFENKIRQLVERVAGTVRVIDFASSITATKSVSTARNMLVPKAIELVVTESCRRVATHSPGFERGSKSSPHPSADGSTAIKRTVG